MELNGGALKPNRLTPTEALVARALRRGGYAVLRSGLPDFLVLGDGDATWVEVKSGYQKPDKQQELMHRVLRGLGFGVVVVTVDPNEEEAALCRRLVEKFGNEHPGRKGLAIRMLSVIQPWRKVLETTAESLTVMEDAIQWLHGTAMVADTTMKSAEAAASLSVYETTPLLDGESQSSAESPAVVESPAVSEEVGAEVIKRERAAALCAVIDLLTMLLRFDAPTESELLESLARRLDPEKTRDELMMKWGGTKADAR